jgi:hypothetical protein
MLSRIVQSLLAVCLTTSAWGANDPLVAKWKVNAAKSTLLDEMTVERAGANRYAITFAPGQVDTVVADGTDQPAVGGSTLSITVRGSNDWEVVRKMQGRMLLKAHWVLSEDGKTLNDAFTQYLPDGMSLFGQPLPNGTTLVLPYVYQRTAGQSGFLGTWDSDSAKVRAGIELEIQQYDADGLSFKRSDESTAMILKLDGSDHPVGEKSGDQSAAYSVRRLNARTMEVTDKSAGKITGTRRIELSTDLKTLTIAEQLLGQHQPKGVLVFDRE